MIAYRYHQLADLQDLPLSRLLHLAGLSTAEACHLLHRSERSLRRWAVAGVPEGPRHHLYCRAGFLEAVSPYAVGFRLFGQSILTPTGQTFPIRELEIIGLRCQLLGEYERRLIRAGLF